MKNIDDTNAIINIKNSQTFNDHDETVEITSTGKFYSKNGKFYILYKEYSDMGEISIMIKAEGGKVSVRRGGACNAVMNYVENNCEEVVYRLPFGDTVFELRTRTVENNLTEDGGTLALDYDLVLNYEVYRNQMEIKIERKDN